MRAIAIAVLLLLLLQVGVHAIGMQVPPTYNKVIEAGDRHEYAITVVGDDEAREFEFFVKAPVGVDIVPFGEQVNPDREYKDNFAVDPYGKETVAFELIGKNEGTYDVEYGIVYADGEFFKESVSNAFEIDVVGNDQGDDGLDVEVPGGDDDDDDDNDDSTSSGSSGGGSGGGSGGSYYIYDEVDEENETDNVETVTETTPEETKPEPEQSRDPKPKPDPKTGGSGEQMQNIDGQTTATNEMAVAGEDPPTERLFGGTSDDDIAGGALLFAIAMLIASSVINLVVIRKVKGEWQ